MTRTHVPHLLSDYLRDLLPSEQRRAVTAHLDQCATCRLQLAAQQRLEGELSLVLGARSTVTAAKQESFRRFTKNNQGWSYSVSSGLSVFAPIVVSLVILLFLSPGHFANLSNLPGSTLEMNLYPPPATLVAEETSPTAAPRPRETDLPTEHPEQTTNIPIPDALPTPEPGR